MSQLPTGTVTLLLADVEGSTRLWESDSAAMTAAVARLDETLAEVIECHRGARPVEQGEGDSFVVAFARASDAVACALDLQLADLAPIKLRIGLHTGEVQLRDEGNYIGPAINRCARLRNLAHGGQTVLSQSTHDVVDDRVPADAWLLDLGTHRLRDLARPERVLQLCHPDLQVEFPALRSLDALPHNLPVQLTNFIGRDAELAELQSLLRETRLLTLTGAGGAGKTRLALQLGADILDAHRDGIWHADLSTITEPALLALVVVRAAGLPDQPAHEPVSLLVEHFRNGTVLLVLDNCEHLIAVCAELTETLLRACPSLTIVATSREPLGVAGEVTWRVPSLGLPDDDTSLRSEAMQLFEDRARHARPGFQITDGNFAAVAEICRRLDGIPLAIELAAARVRVLSPERIAKGLHDRFRLLAGGARTAMPRQQTLRASVDWSFNLLTQPERVLFRRLAVFAGSFDLDAAEVVGEGDPLEMHQVLDQLSLLVDKSLVVTDGSSGDTRYRLLETVRQFAMDHLADSGEAEGVRGRHRDHYLSVAERVHTSIVVGQPLAHARTLLPDWDNLRTAFRWSRDNSDAVDSLRISVSTYFLAAQGDTWREASGWLDEVLEDDSVTDAPPALRVRGLIASAHLIGVGSLDPRGPARADEAVAIARAIEDPILLGHALVGVGMACTYLDQERGEPALREAVALARQTQNEPLLKWALTWLGATVIGRDLVEARAVLEEGGADTWAACAMVMQGDLDDARATISRDRTGIEQLHGYLARGLVLIFSGEYEAAAICGKRLIEAALGFGLHLEAVHGDALLGLAALAVGDIGAARSATASDRGILSGPGQISGHWIGTIRAEAELADGNVDAARLAADQTIGRARAADIRYGLEWALRARARVALAEGEIESAEALAHEALTVAHELGDKMGVTEALELLALLSNGEHGTRLFGSAVACRTASGFVRFPIYTGACESSVAALRAELGDESFNRVFAEGAALSLEGAVAYAQRGRGERKRPAAGWASLTPAELDVVRLVGDGLANKEIAEKLFVSPRTVQAHLTHIYAKLGTSSRVQLAKEVARHG
ncbi:MAG: hypothetical protein QOI95_1044 [Acidimicrobiaceae bacterium]|jgi:predicted ATPase/class 3 adenylate cyclase/DNA-binding CsgD family transcriptional regulator